MFCWLCALSLGVKGMDSRGNATCRVDPHRTAGDGAQMAACTVRSHGVEPAAQLRVTRTDSGGWRVAEGPDAGTQGLTDDAIPRALARMLLECESADA